MSSSEHDSTADVSHLLQKAGRGDQRASEELLGLVYERLRRMAQRRLARLGPGQTLQPTVLVHDAWLQLVGSDEREWEGRAHFFGVAAVAMRDIVVEQARKKRSLKRGGDRKAVPLVDEDVLAVHPSLGGDVLELDAALRRLQLEYPRKEKIVMLRFFAGLSMPEISRQLDLPLRTVEREWQFARTWLRREVGGTTDAAE